MEEVSSSVVQLNVRTSSLHRNPEFHSFAVRFHGHLRALARDGPAEDVSSGDSQGIRTGVIKRTQASAQNEPSDSSRSQFSEPPPQDETREARSV